MNKAELAREAWRLLIEAMFERQGHFMALASESGLNPGSLKLLITLDPSQPVSMRTLARSIRCDASVMTWLVDRLEEREMVERRVSPRDRRVKAVVLTKKGMEAQEMFMSRLLEPPPSFASLTVDDLKGVAKALGKLPAARRPGLMPVARARPKRE